MLYGDPIAKALVALPALVGLQAWFPDPAVHFAANGVEWSVSAELFFYALFPLLMRWAAARGGRIALTVAAVGLGFVLPSVLPLIVPADLASWAMNILPVTRVGGFLCGLLLALRIREGRHSPVGLPLAVLLTSAAYLVLPLTPAWVPQRAVLLIAVLLLVSALAQADLRGRRTLVGLRLPVELGVWSYCFYLVHQVTMQILLFLCAGVLQGPLLGPVWFVVSLLASVGLAALLHGVVEAPSERRLRGARRSGSATELPVRGEPSTVDTR